MIFIDILVGIVKMTHSRHMVNIDKVLPNMPRFGFGFSALGILGSNGPCPWLLLSRLVLSIVILVYALGIKDTKCTIL